jgi:hypothetical protein
MNGSDLVFVIPIALMVILPALIVAVMLAAVMRLLIRASRHQPVSEPDERALLATGTAAPAVVVDVSQPRYTQQVRSELLLEIGLEVRPADRPPFAARVHKRIPLEKIPQVQPGCTVEVRYDPAEPSQVALASP